MALDETARFRVWAHIMRLPGASIAGVTKADLRAAIDATDDWIEAAQGATAPPTGYNSALPQPFRSAATPQQKAVLFAIVLMRRAGLLDVAEDLF